MYEQYTDKQIVEMLVPKLNKAVPEVDWRAELFYNDRLIKALSIVYRSGYIRGQLGRSFIIGEPKQTGHWVPATKSNVKMGDKVRFLNAKKHEQNPEFYPSQGTTGEAVSDGDDEACLVQWPGYETSWYARWSGLEVLLCK